MLVHFGWSPNPEPDVTGYKLYVARSSMGYVSGGVAGSPVILGNVLSASFNLIDSGPYFFALTVVTASGGESSFSAEVTGVFFITPLGHARSGVQYVGARLGRY